jgi:hypothetical protein
VSLEEFDQFLKESLGLERVQLAFATAQDEDLPTSIDTLELWP